ncbi:MAG: alpha/beta fold hydrolase [Gemmatimonadota bacterium]
MTSATRFSPDRRLFPFRSRWFESSMGSLHYVDEGTGQPLLLLHGNPTWSFLYRGIVIRLKKRFRCIAVDYPGFGLSAHPGTDRYGYTPEEHAGVVGELVDGLALADLTVVGQDWGGPIGLRVAADRRSRIRALVMGNTWFWPLDPTDVRDLPLWLFGQGLSTEFGRRLILERNLFVERILPLGLKHEVAQKVLDHYEGPLESTALRTGVAELPRQLLDSEEWLAELAEAVPAILGDKPLLLTWGMEDPAFRPSLMDRFRSVFASVRTVPLDARHYIQEDAPGEMASAIRDFLENAPTNG